jgi:phosphoenolpyruvate synthase/pyruvate phosphate dikinase
MNIFWLNAAAAPPPNKVGGKAATLARLQTLGIRIPPGFAVSADMFRMFLEDNNLIGRVMSLSQRGELDELELALGQLAHDVERATWPADLRLEIIEAYRKLSGPVAIRSSGIAEDSAASSFAGAFSSFLNRTTEDDILSAVQACWSSAFSKRVAAYRLAHHLVGFDWLMGVIVQRMIFADKAGVMFTVDPYVENNGMLIEAVAGGCEQIVSGGPADISVRIDRETSAITFSPEVPPSARRFGSGAVPVLGMAKSPTPRLLRNGEINTLVKIGLNLERALGEPQDVEWAHAGDEFIILQSRPLTAYHHLKVRT